MVVAWTRWPEADASSVPSWSPLRYDGLRQLKAQISLLDWFCPRILYTCVALSILEACSPVVYFGGGELEGSRDEPGSHWLCMFLHLSPAVVLRCP